MDSLNIYQRINKVMKKGLYLKKGSAGQGTGVQYDELIAMLAPHLVEAGIVITTEKSGESRSRANAKGSYIYECDFNVHFINIDDPKDRFTNFIEAHAMDAGDKAPGKATTYATKTVIVKVFGIESGDKEESRAEERASEMDVNIVSADQVKQIGVLLLDSNGNLTPKGQAVWRKVKFNQIVDMTVSQYRKVIELCSQ